MFLETGMIKSLGVLLPELREQFTAQTWVIGLAISLIPGFGVVTCELFCLTLKPSKYEGFRKIRELRGHNWMHFAHS